MNIALPSTGRLGNLIKTLMEEVGQEIVYELFEDYESLMKGKQLSEWIISMVLRLEQKLGTNKAVQIIEKDGKKSCTKGFKNTVKKIINKSSSIEEFVKKLQEHYKKSSFFEYTDDGNIISGHNKCYMMIKYAPKPITTKLFCHFCVGHNKEFYETALHKSLQIEILETIMTGGETCKFRIKL